MGEDRDEGKDEDRERAEGAAGGEGGDTAPEAGRDTALQGGEEAGTEEGAELERAAAAELDAAEAPAPSPTELRAILEALIFASPQPLTSREIQKVLSGVDKEAWYEALEALKAEYAPEGRGLQLVEVAGGWQITTRPEFNDWVRELLDPKSPTRLSIQALETLAVIAYKQPATLPEIIELRGVKSGGVVKTLLEKRLIRIVGRKEVVGRPILYGTTKQFLLHFGLKDLSELPKIEEFAEVLGEEVDVAGLKRAIDAPRPVEILLAEADEAGSSSSSEDTPPESDRDPI